MNSQNQSVPNSSYWYLIDSADRIIQVSSNWDQFAKENKGESSLSNQIFNRDLWSFISDPETAVLYQAIVDRVRKQGVQAVFPFRCDGPTCRRFMRMYISLNEPDKVEFKSEIEKEESRTAVPLLDSGILRNNKLLIVCGWCKNVKCQESWLEVEEAMRKLRLFENSNLPKISHGICQSCRTAIEEQLTSIQKT